MKRFTFLLVSLSLCLSSCVFQEEHSTYIKTSSDFNTTINHDYAEISKYRLYWDEIFEVNLKEYFVYLYQRGCSHCESIKNEVIEAALARENIYFVEDSKEAKFSKDVTNTIGIKSVDELSILGFPSLLKIEEGTLVKNVAGVKEIRDMLFL